MAEFDESSDSEYYSDDRDDDSDDNIEEPSNESVESDESDNSDDNIDDENNKIMKIKSACSYGNSIKVHKYVGNNIELCEDAFIFACKYGKSKIICDMMEKGIKCFEKGLTEACNNGDIDCINLILYTCEDKNIFSENLQKYLEDMDLNKNFHVLKHFLKYFEHRMDISNLVSIMCYKYQDTDTRIIDYLLLKSPGVDMDDILETACYFNNIRIVKYIIEKGKDNFVFDFDFALYQATRSSTGYQKYDSVDFDDEYSYELEDLKDIMVLLFSRGAMISRYINTNCNNYHFKYAFDCLYKMTTIKQYKYRIENMKNLDLLGLCNDIKGIVTEYF